MDICKVCGKEFKKMTAMHLTTHGINFEQYDKLPEFEANVEVEPQGNTEVTADEMKDRIWGKQERDVNRPLSEFLNEFGVTEKEAREVLRKFTTGARIDPRIQAENFKKIGVKGATELEDKDNVETTSLHVAEELCNKGFIVTSVKGKVGNTPKTWFLKKVKN